jgi:hypothetical protein
MDRGFDAAASRRFRLSGARTTAQRPIEAPAVSRLCQTFGGETR